MRTRIWASVVVVASVVALLAAQIESVAITGVATDPSGAVVPGVSITLTGPEKRTAVTDGRGEFSFIRLRPGRYEIEGWLAGFKTVRGKVALTVGQTGRIALRLTPGTIAETVALNADSILVDTQTTARARLAE